MSKSSSPKSGHDQEPVAMSAVYVSFLALQAKVRHELTGEQIEATVAQGEAEALLRELRKQVEETEGAGGGQPTA
jgi:hypothetical protein